MHKPKNRHRHQPLFQPAKGQGDEFPNDILAMALEGLPTLPPRSPLVDETTYNTAKTWYARHGMYLSDDERQLFFDGLTYLTLTPSTSYISRHYLGMQLRVRREWIYVPLLAFLFGAEHVAKSYAAERLKSLQPMWNLADLDFLALQGIAPSTKIFKYDGWRRDWDKRENVRTERIMIDGYSPRYTPLQPLRFVPLYDRPQDIIHDYATARRIEQDKQEGRKRGRTPGLERPKKRPRPGSDSLPRSDWEIIEKQSSRFVSTLRVLDAGTREKLIAGCYDIVRHQDIDEEARQAGRSLLQEEDVGIAMAVCKQKQFMETLREADVELKHRIIAQCQELANTHEVVRMTGDEDIAMVDSNWAMEVTVIDSDTESIN